MTEFVPEAIQIIANGLISFILLAIITAVGEFFERFMDMLR